MQRAAACAVLFVVVGVSAGRAQQVEEQARETIKVEAPGPYRPQSTPDLQAAAEKIVKLTNRFRARKELSALKKSPHLTQAAQYFAEFMAQRDLYGHTADDSRPAERARKFDYEYCLVAENIAYRFETTGFTTGELAKDFVRGWKESPGHRRNMLRPAVQQTGVAIARSEHTGVFYAVQMFGRPKSASIEFTVSNPSTLTVAYRVGEQKFELPAHFIRRHEMCREAKLKFMSQPEAQADGNHTAIEPRDGASYRVESSAPNAYRVVTDASPTQAE